MTGPKFAFFALCPVFFLACSDIGVIDPYARTGAPAVSETSSSSSEFSSSSVVSSSSYDVSSSSSDEPSSSSNDGSSSSSDDASSSSSDEPSSSSNDGSSSSSSDDASSSSSDDGFLSSSSTQCSDFVDGTMMSHYGKDKAKFCDERDGKEYVYVHIDGKNWMAENLNYEADGSKCVGFEGITGELLDKGGHCDTYGRLYNWDKAMEVCPSGWHLPSDDEWNKLTQAVGGTTSPHYLTGAATPLKTIGSWNINEGYIAGTDEVGFSAIPGGTGYPDGSFDSFGEFGRWWSATESSDTHAYRRRMDYNNISVDRSSINKNNLMSVRCIQDGE